MIGLYPWSSTEKLLNMKVLVPYFGRGISNLWVCPARNWGNTTLLYLLFLSWIPSIFDQLVSRIQHERAIFETSKLGPYLELVPSRKHSTWKWIVGRLISFLGDGATWQVLLLLGSGSVQSSHVVAPIISIPQHHQGTWDTKHWHIPWRWCHETRHEGLNSPNVWLWPGWGWPRARY